MSSFGQTTLSPCLENDGDGIGGNEQQAGPNHWIERGRATAVYNSDATERPRRPVLSLGVISMPSLSMRSFHVGVAAEAFTAELNYITRL